MVAFSKLAAVVALAGSASAHTVFQRLWVNGVTPGQNVGIRVPLYDGPITDVSHNGIICNGAGINPMRQPPPGAIIDVPISSTLTMEWHHGTEGPNPLDSSDPVDPTHKGPIMVYLAKVDDALTPTVTGLKWFKIYEDGLDVATNTWAVDKFVAAKGYVDFKLPSCIPPGNYLLRGELLALHGASGTGGAQFYMSCAQINVIGGGNANPPTVNFPGAYSATDPGILVNIYYPPLSTYVIPGPRPFTCGGTQPTSSPTTLRTSTTSSRTTTTSSRTTTTTSSRTTTTSSSSSRTTTTPNWTGPTTCAQGTCKFSGDYYSQCLP
ncbi:hypothetical protein DRE_04056 [Drechslerella stenobrocha 248]|uniref:AA9 family lytic polysaccharide monooxygenase n=1 Tax=Drechslerella stenobrocha 248 TaxID=1043628 RepID=W7HRW9_9PEZI|nr:hypothetical protein DRE_04056 [Drechslerella stenobrocha 248]